MEANTFATTVFARTPASTAFAYLRHLPHLDEWTLGSRMRTRIDDDTWMGTASGYQTMLCYHVHALAHPQFLAIEWQCGYRWRDYFKQYPVFVFPSSYIDPGDSEDGSYIHWISVIDPARRTPMIMQGIEAVHRYEGRGLKAALERRAGLAAPAEGRWHIETDTIYVDAPIELAAAELGDTARLPLWAPLFRTDPQSADGRDFRDEYDRRVRVTFAVHRLDDYVLVEQDYEYPELGVRQRHPAVLVPSSRAFSSAASGFLLHRLAFRDRNEAPRCGRLGRDELAAENMALKHRLEATAECIVRMAPETVRAVQEGTPKGDALQVARVAGIMAAKKTSELIPLCHPLPLTSVAVDFEFVSGGVRIGARARVVGQTGVEMEALTAAAVAGLTLIDMTKGVERGVYIESVRLLEKSGGRSGTWRRKE